MTNRIDTLYSIMKERLIQFVRERQISSKLLEGDLFDPQIEIILRAVTEVYDMTSERFDRVQLFTQNRLARILYYPFVVIKPHSLIFSFSPNQYTRISAGTVLSFSKEKIEYNFTVLDDEEIHCISDIRTQFHALNSLDCRYLNIDPTLSGLEIAIQFKQDYIWQGSRTLIRLLLPEEVVHLFLNENDIYMRNNINRMIKVGRSRINFDRTAISMIEMNPFNSGYEYLYNYFYNEKLYHILELDIENVQLERIVSFYIFIPYISINLNLLANPIFAINLFTAKTTAQKLVVDQPSILYADYDRRSYVKTYTVQKLFAIDREQMTTTLVGNSFFSYNNKIMKEHNIITSLNWSTEAFNAIDNSENLSIVLHSNRENIDELYIYYAEILCFNLIEQSFLHFDCRLTGHAEPINISLYYERRAIQPLIADSISYLRLLSMNYLDFAFFQEKHQYIYDMIRTIGKSFGSEAEFLNDIEGPIVKQIARPVIFKEQPIFNAICYSFHFIISNNQLKNILFYKILALFIRSFAPANMLVDFTFIDKYSQKIIWVDTIDANIKFRENS